MADIPAGAAAIEPDDLAQFLDDLGWRREIDQPRWLGDTGELWASPGRGQEVLVPRNRSFRDYGQVVREACDVVATFLDIEPSTVMRRVLSVPFDVIRLRVHPDDSRSTLDLGDAMRLVTNARSMMAAAAASAVAPRPNHGPRRPPEAESYVRRLQLAHTERGSFVVVIHSPVGRLLSEVETQQTIGDGANDGTSQAASLTGRSVAVGMLDAVDTARGAAQHAVEEGRIEVFEETVASGVSANLCTALAELSDIGGEERLRLSVDWSPRIPLEVDEDFDPMDERPIGTGYQLMYLEAAKYLRSLEDLDAIRVVGEVRSLKRSPGELMGEATVRATVAGRSRSVRLLLPLTEYGAAIAAHEQERPLSAVGSLRREGRSLMMDSPTNVEML